MRSKIASPLYDNAVVSVPSTHSAAERCDSQQDFDEVVDMEYTRADRERERLHAIAAAVNAARDLDEILLMVRNAIVEVEGFERAGVYLVEHGIFHGTWGTDEYRQICDEHHLILHPELLLPNQVRVLQGETAYSIDSYTPAIRTDLAPDLENSERDFVMIGLRARGEMMGLITADNLFSGRTITKAEVEALLPFCEQVAVAIANARLLAERGRMVERQRRFMEIAAAITASQKLDEILRMVRDAIVDAGGFDRAAVFLLDRERGLICSAWGTDREGQLEELKDTVIVIEPGSTDPLSRVIRGEVDYVLTTNFEEEYHIEPDNPMFGVHAHAVVSLQVDGVVVGAVAVDNLLSDAPITAEDVYGLLPFANLAAVAIHNARLFSELRQAQEALVRAEKLRAVGELASGVAHNVNNVLAAVLGYAELIQSTEGATPEVQHYARTVERAAMDGAQIVRRMQQFARMKTDAGKVPFDLALAVQEAVDLTRPAWHDQAVAHGVKIEVRVDLAKEIWVLGEASEIREVIVNLIANAAHAMPRGGTMALRGYTANRQAVVEVRDTGVGMDEQTRQRIFEPFFTTKGPGLGTGLGLSVAWGIINQHGGRIEVESKLGEGSLFRVLLPLTETCTITPASQDREMSLAGARILLVEDQELVLTGLARVLTGRGAEVAIAIDGTDAWEWLQAHGADCDMILSDHGMVGITGTELLARVREHYPHIRRVLLSGWGVSLPGEHDASAAELILTKPVRQNKLVAALAALLSSQV